MSRPDIRYARAPGGVSIAYERFGAGHSVLVMGGGHLPFEAAWEEPVYTRFLERLGEVSSIIRFDRRGTGLSDSPTSAEPYAFEQAATDFVAVLDRERVERASIVALAGGDSGNALACAATHPSRVDRMVLMHPSTRWDRMSTEFGTSSLRDALDDRRWKTGEAYRTLFFPSRADDERFVDRFLRWRRRVVTSRN